MVRFLLTNRDALPKSLTSYDLLKSLALILMIVDHIGHYFYPDIIWFRVIGRLSVPIWFFLIGYADTRHVQPVIWIGGAVLSVSSVIAGEYLFPMSILFMLGISRLMIDGVMVRALRNYEAFAGMFFLMMFAAFPTLLLFEYGTLGLLFAMFGYMCRHRADIRIHPLALFGFIAAILLTYIVFQGILLPSLSALQLGVFFAGMVVVMALLFFFRSVVFNGVFLKPLQITGRYTLEIYVLHLLVFRGVAMVLFPDRFTLFDVQFMPMDLGPKLLSFMGL